jgi:hypothetical protein
MRSKVVGSAVAAAFAVSVAVPGAVLAQEKPQVLVWTDSVRQPGFETYRDLVADEVDVKVEIQDINQVLGKIQLANQAGSGWPDVIFADPSDLALLVSPQIDYALEWTPELAGEGFLEDFGNANNWCEIDGKTWCVKNDLAQSVLWYDTKVFEELGLTVPTTMEEWAATAMKLEGTGYVAGALGDENFYASYLWPSGCPLALPVSDSEVRINSQDPACTRVADLIQPLVDAGVLDRRGSFDAGFLVRRLRHQARSLLGGPRGPHRGSPDAHLGRRRRRPLRRMGRRPVHRLQQGPVPPGGDRHGQVDGQRPRPCEKRSGVPGIRSGKRDLDGARRRGSVLRG